MLATFLGVKGLLMTNDKYIAQGFYASFAYFTFALGLSMLIIPALLGKAQFIRFFFGGDLWSPFYSIAYGIYMTSPMISLFYFLSMSTALHIDYQMFFYYFCGNFVFTITLTNILYVFIDRPFFSLIKNSYDIQQAYKNLTEQSDINNYKVGVVLGEDVKANKGEINVGSATNNNNESAKKEEGKIIMNILD